MHWTVASPSVLTPKDFTLTDYVPGDRHRFTSIPREGKQENWHNRASEKTDLQEWMRLWKQSREAFTTTQGGVLTVFPQPAALAGLQQRVVSPFGKRVPVVAHWFDVDYSSFGGWRGWLARRGLRDVDRFLVFTNIGRKVYSDWLNIEIDRFELLRFYKEDRELGEPIPEETEQPYIVAAGSAYRDFPILFEAVKRLNIRTMVISGPRALAGLELPPQVEAPFGLEKPEVLKRIRQARISIVPVYPIQPVGGIFTIVEAMRLGRPLIATRYEGIDDYVTDEETGLLVEPSSVDALAAAIDRLWNDAELRNRLGTNAYQYGKDYLSGEAAGAALGKVLDRVADEYGIE